jgi:hypothetical protein
MTLENAIAGSCTHNQIVDCEFAGTEKELLVWLNDNTAGGQRISRENDGSIDVADDAWRVRVTLVDAE